jgi:NAD(P)H dehydrogenase (quinone)
VQAARFDAQLEQRHASDHDALPAAVAAELALMDRADLIILQYPMWWHLPPAILKGWFDRVFAYGAVYTSTRRFENGRFVGKRAMLSLTVGSGEATYGFNGRSGDMDLLLWPVNFSLAFVGYTVLQPFVAYGVEAGLRYSAPDVLDARFRRLGQELAAAMATVEGRAAIPFTRMSEWGADGRIVADAPAYSPFIRHRKELAVE